MNRFLKVGLASAVTAFAVLAGVSGVAAAEGDTATPGGVFITGHDPDFHATSSAGAKKIFQTAVRYVTDNQSNPKILLVTDLRDKGTGFIDSRRGLEAAGYMTYDVADYGSGTRGVYDLHTVDFNNYDVVIVASDHGGWLRQEEVDILNSRVSDVIDYVNHGGGLVAFAESGYGASSVQRNRFGFLPFVVADNTLHQSEVGNKVMPAGLAMGLTDADVSRDVSHNIFVDSGGMEVVDVDRAGHILSLATKKKISVDGPITDSTAPVTTIELVSDQPSGSNGWFTTEVDLIGRCHDDSDGATRTQVRINNGEWVDLTESLHFGDGVYTVEYRSTDAAGNVEETKSISFKVDTTAPTTTATLPEPTGEGGWYTSDVDVTLTAEDNVSGASIIQYDLGDGIWTTYNGSLRVTRNCGCKIRYRSGDEAGNWETPKELEVKIDKTAPTVNIRLANDTLWPPNHKYVPINLIVDATDEDSGIASIVLTSVTSNEPDEGLGDGNHTDDVINAAYGTYDTSFDVRRERSGKGTGRVYTATYKVTDKAGNVTVASATITVPHDQSANSTATKPKK